MRTLFSEVCVHNRVGFGVDLVRRKPGKLPLCTAITFAGRAVVDEMAKPCVRLSAVPLQTTWDVFNYYEILLISQKV